MSRIIIILLLVILLAVLYNCHNKDTFSALGALQQLYAKDNQDLYLTTDTEKYTVPVYGRHYLSPWNMPTRLNKYYEPLFGYY
jgi:hypothetical protein